MPGARPLLRIAIVDSGVNPGHRQVGPVAGGVRIAWRDGAVRLRTDWGDGIGHGTAIAATVCEGLPEDRYALLSVRVFGLRLDAPAACLAAGIRWAADQDARILNLSAGVPPGSDPDGEALLRAAAVAVGEDGRILVAPRTSGGGLLLPGAWGGLPGILGVEADARLEHGALGRRGSVLIAPPWARPLPPLPRERNFSGVSLAVAAVTNRAARFLLREGAPGDLPDALVSAAPERPE